MKHGIAMGIWAFVAMMTGCIEPGDAVIESSKQTGLIFVKEPGLSSNHRPERSNVNEFNSGTDIYLLRPVSPNGKLTNLTAPFTRGNETNSERWGAALDPEVSPDGKYLIFSMRERNSRGTKWYLYEMNLETSEIVQLTTKGDDMDPYYLPDGRIVFTSTRNEIVDEYERRQSPQLHIGERDPKTRKLINIKQISQNQSHDMNPIVYSHTGEIFFTRWEHLGRVNRMPIFKVDPDGTGLFVVYGSQTPQEAGGRTYLDVRELRNGGLVSSIMRRGDDFEGGAIAMLDISESEDNLTYLTENPFDRDHPPRFLYKTPHPIMNGDQEMIIAAGTPYLNAREGENRFSDYGLYLIDKEGGTPKLIYNDPNTNDYDPIPIDEKGSPLTYRIKGDDSRVVEGYEKNEKTGRFFTADVYDRSTTDGHLVIKREYRNAKFVRVLEAVSLPVDRELRGGDIGETNLEKERVVGYGSVHPDGSFSIEAPTEKALHVQVLDSNGMMLISQLSWIQVMPGEHRICTGCHARHDRNKVIEDLVEDPLTGEVTNIKENKGHTATFANAEDIQSHPSLASDTLEFFNKFIPNKENTIQSIFNRRCNSCHGNKTYTTQGGELNLEIGSNELIGVDSLNGADLKTPSSVYERLWADRWVVEGDSLGLVSGGGAARSPLVWVLFNKKLNPDAPAEILPKTLSYDHTAIWAKDSAGVIRTFAEENRDLLRIIEWIDMGGQYSNTVGY